VKADARIRTADPFITSEVLYQLSYVGPARATFYARWSRAILIPGSSGCCLLPVAQDSEFEAGRWAPKIAPLLGNRKNAMFGNGQGR
jgi:hypothetical protein